MAPFQKKLTFLIASGPTQEPLDPVRFLSNRSTGVMGGQLARVVRERGYRLLWLKCPEDAMTANELLKKLRKRLPKADVLVMAAAVCDVRPKSVSDSKLKKKSLSSISLVENPDILKELSRIKKKHQVFVGFALETRNAVKNALQKMKSKKLEAIVLQTVTKKKQPFGDRLVDALIFCENEPVVSLKRCGKKELARRIIEGAERLFLKKSA